ncbi:MAG TPA: cobyric acid synthase [Dehalococcoidales bacterium]
MLQGTASSVGKSVLVTALCRIFHQDGFKVAPFKSQNMALNSFVTTEGGEIGRAQAVQAQAAGIAPTVDMNPVLIKPEAGAKAQVIVMGKVAQHLNADNYSENAPRLLKTIENSFNRLRAAYDIIVIEGAGSPAEINLKEREIVNMRIAKMADSPVLLVGDIDRGGVFAALVGTLDLLDLGERDRVKGFIINKCRRDVSLLKPGLDFLEAKTGKPVVGVIPYFRDIAIAQEDSVYLDERPAGSLGHGPDVAVIHLPHISNYDDFDPLEEAGCHVRYVDSPAKLGQPDLIILPGTKSTVHDLIFLRQQGLAEAISRLKDAGTPVIGICGGYQMLGQTIKDPCQVESSREVTEALGFLEIDTIFSQQKTTRRVKGHIVAAKGFLAGLNDSAVEGYEIHMGQTVEPERSPLIRITEATGDEAGYCDGAVSPDGLVCGTYFHGFFHNPEVTRVIVQYLGQRRGLAFQGKDLKGQDKEYDKLAAFVRSHLDIEKVYGIIGVKLKGKSTT